MTSSLPLPYSTPESEGVSSAALSVLIDSLDKLKYMHGVTVFRHGKVILQASWKPYSPGVPHHLFSLSKSFVSCAAGFAISEGLLGFETTLGELFPEETGAPGVPASVGATTIRNLLTMRGVHGACAMMGSIFKGDHKALLEGYMRFPAEFRPGEAFTYDSGNTYMLSAALQKVTGMDLVAYLQPRLFDSLGIKPPFWQQDYNGVRLGGWGLFLSLEDISRFTKLISEGGVWEGRQLLPREYIEAATSFQSENAHNKTRDWSNGYGYQFWMCSHDGAFRGDGACGQFAIVIPDYDIAIATEAGLPEMGNIMADIWDKFLPLVDKEGKALVPDRAAQHALAARLSDLELPRPMGAFASDQEGGVFKLAPNREGFEKLGLEFQASGGKLTLVKGGEYFDLPFAYNGWAFGHAGKLYGRDRATLGGDTAISAAWESPNVLLLNMAFINEPTFSRLRIEFQGRTTIRVQREFHLWFLYGGDDMKADILGHRE